MNVRLIFYFLGVFFTSMAGGFSPAMTSSSWAQLVVCSLAAAFTAAGAFLDQSAGPRGPGVVASNLARGTTLLCIATAVIWLQGCGTRVYGRDGRAQLVTYANAGALKFRGPGTYLEIRDLDHATPTREAFTGVMLVTTAAGAAAAGLR